MRPAKNEQGGDKTYYCPKCDAELTPTPSGYYTCLNGCVKLLGKRHCQNHCSMSRRQRERLRRLIAEREAAKERMAAMPMCDVELEKSRRKYFWVEGLDGMFRKEGDGEIEGCVHALWKDKSKRRAPRIVSLRKLSTEEATKVIFGA